jgi:hypothetical protein
MPRIRCKKAIVAGASGVVGRRLAEYLHGQDDWEVVGLSRSKPIGGNDVQHIVVDLSDRTDTDTKLRHLCGVTHIFYEVRFDYEEGQPEPIKTNFSMSVAGTRTTDYIQVRPQHPPVRMHPKQSSQVSTTYKKTSSVPCRRENFGPGQRRARPAYAIRPPALHAA